MLPASDRARLSWWTDEQPLDWARVWMHRPSEFQSPRAGTKRTRPTDPSSLGVSTTVRRLLPRTPIVYGHARTVPADWKPGAARCLLLLWRREGCSWHLTRGEIVGQFGRGWLGYSRHSRADTVRSKEYHTGSRGELSMKRWKKSFGSKRPSLPTIVLPTEFHYPTEKPELNPVGPVRRHRYCPRNVPKRAWATCLAILVASVPSVQPHCTPSAAGYRSGPSRPVVHAFVRPRYGSWDSVWTARARFTLSSDMSACGADVTWRCARTASWTRRKLPSSWVQNEAIKPDRPLKDLGSVTLVSETWRSGADTRLVTSHCRQACQGSVSPSLLWVGSIVPRDACSHCFCCHSLLWGRTLAGHEPGRSWTLDQAPLKTIQSTTGHLRYFQTSYCRTEIFARDSRQVGP